MSPNGSSEEYEQLEARLKSLPRGQFHDRFLAGKILLPRHRCCRGVPHCLRSAWIFDPGTSTWTRATDLNEGPLRSPLNPRRYSRSLQDRRSLVPSLGNPGGRRGTRDVWASRIGQRPTPLVTGVLIQNTTETRKGISENGLISPSATRSVHPTPRPGQPRQLRARCALLRRSRTRPTRNPYRMLSVPSTFPWRQACRPRHTSHLAKRSTRPTHRHAARHPELRTTCASAPAPAVTAAGTVEYESADAEASSITM